MSRVEWLGEETGAGFLERSFLLRRRTGIVPGVLWSPGTGLLHPGLCAPGLMMTAARAVCAPVLYHVQWDDEIFPRDGQFELFDVLASVDKRLIARSGPHAETHPDDEASWQEFISTSAPGACSR